MCTDPGWIRVVASVARPSGSPGHDPPGGRKGAGFLAGRSRRQARASERPHVEGKGRGGPAGLAGYQCPICDLQVHDYIASAPAFAAAKARILFVYPGPADGLITRAREFAEWKGKQWPKDYLFVLDPVNTMVNAYGLRWDAPRESAYPSTFIIDNKRVVRFVKVSRTHGDRSKAAAVLKELEGLR